MKKPVGYICEPCEFLTIELIQRIEDAHKEFKTVGVGIHSDDFFVELNGRNPIKTYEDRASLVSALKGVDFIFELTSKEDLDSSNITYTSVVSSVELPKPYHVAYAPGTYDLFHEGHMSHLKEVKSLCDILVVGVNSDSLVWDNKKKKTKVKENERLDVVKNLDFVDYVFLIEKNQKSYEIKCCTDLVNEPVDVIFFGSDLRNADVHNDTKIPILFTERDPILMKRRSSSYYRQVLEELKSK